MTRSLSQRSETKRAAPPIRVVLVDDQALFRAGIRMLVDSQPDLEVVGEAADGREAIEVVRRAAPDVVLMDIRMPVLDGLAATAELLRDPQPPRIVMLTTFDLDEAVARAIRQGASGFLLKDADPEFLLAAIRTVHAGSAVIAASATRELFANFTDAAPRPVPPAYGALTQREREIFALAARAIRQGASGFLLKDADPEFLLAAIRTVHAGSAVIAASATRELFANFSDAAPRPVPPAYGALTQREREIFALAARGLSNAEIAAREFLSEATVKTHISRVLTKLGLRDRVQLVVFAFEHGLA